MKFFFIIFVLLSNRWAFASASTPLVLRYLNLELSDLAPYSYLSDGKLAGINAEYINHLEKSSDLKFNVEFYPHARLIKRLETGSAEAMLIFRVLCEKFPTQYESLIPVYSITPSIYLRTSSTTNKSDIRIVRIRGTCTQLLNDYVKKENIEEVVNMELGFRMLNAGRVDGVCGNSPLIRYFNRNHQTPLEIYKTQKKLPDFQAVICVKKSLPAVIKTQLLQGAKKSAYIAMKLESMQDNAE